VPLTQTTKDKFEETKESTDAQDKAGSMLQEYWDIYRKNEASSRQTNANLDLHRFGEDIGEMVHRIKRGEMAYTCSIDQNISQLL
jgi:hypothetical protein